jgi:hypothetical protein
MSRLSGTIREPGGRIETGAEPMRAPGSTW